MKMIMTLVLLTSIHAAATSPQRIICREDQRLHNGSLRELILTSNDQGYQLQSSFIASLDTPTIVVEQWAHEQNCRIDEKSVLAYCKNQDGQSSVQIKERREVFYDSLEDDAKRKTNKYIDISVFENGVAKKTQSFAANHCQLIGDEASA